MTSEIAEVWEQIKHPGTEQLQGRLAPSSSSVWLALDPLGRRHILVDAPGVVIGRSLGTTKGLSALTAELDVASRATSGYVDVTCLDSALNETFTAVAADLIRATSAAPGDTVGAVALTLDTWRWFWGNDAGLNGEEATGLFGELWFLLRWAPWPGAIQSWVGAALLVGWAGWTSVSLSFRLMTLWTRPRWPLWWRREVSNRCSSRSTPTFRRPG